MTRSCSLLSCVVLVLMAGIQQAIGQPPNDFESKLVTISDSNTPLSKALTLIQQQTGNSITNKLDSNPQLKLDINRATFWRALDAVAESADARVSLYETGGRIALTPNGYRKLPVSYHKQFRTSVKRLELSRDLETGKSQCKIFLDAAWEPRFEPLYMRIEKSEIVYASAKVQNNVRHKSLGSGMRNVAKKRVAEIPLSYPAPPRSATKISSLQGKFTLIAPASMLSFKFGRLAPFNNVAKARSQKRDDVEVKLTRLVVRPGRWSFDIAIRKPPDEVEFESFQSWMGNNEIMLVKSDGVKTTTIHPKTEDEELLEAETATGVAVRYHFVESAGTALGKLGDWQLVYRTPGRISEISVPYAFQDVSLP